MADFLTTRVLDNTQPKNNKTRFRVGVKTRKKSELGERYQVELPIEIHLEVGDRIDFYQCTPGYTLTIDRRAPATEGDITPDRFISADFYINKRKILTLTSRDIRLLQMAREYEEH